LHDFQVSRKAQPIGELLARPETIITMEELSRAGRPAVLALDGVLPEGIGLDDTEKKHVGRWIRDVLADRGWRPRKRKLFRSGRIFTSGAVYEQPQAKEAAAAAPDGDMLERLRRAQKIVRRSSQGRYSADDFIRDKRRDAAEEKRRGAAEERLPQE
jgi:hypothetical protein